MGKSDRVPTKLQFEVRKTLKVQGEGVTAPEGVLEGASADLKQILVSMPHSLTKIDGKKDALKYRMNRISARLARHAECLDQKLQQVIAKKEAKGHQRNTQAAGSGDAEEEMGNIE
ncbi:hypothetical protein NDU88_003613 [Pleurodeles waltl]|uniref:Uncharacterized protein n=1 Tax=Pleurodeles waltl TaxID=8319 RepID=A0AAV7LFT8_PLEWA|nr:hypothetical protein NDU88_003613 [Pleurodeles waltl]